MDYIALETQFEMQVMRNQALVDVVNCVRKDILLLEEDENKRLSSSSSSTKGVLDVKISELRAGSIKCHEMQRELIDDAVKLRDFRARQVDGQLGSQLEKCIGQEKAANKIRYDNVKSRLRIEQDHDALMTKILKDVTKSMSLIKVLNYKAGASSGGDMSLINYVEQRLKGKQKDFERLAKQRARVEKLKESMASELRNRVPDDLSSIASSDADSAFESDSETSQLSKMLQENIALTLEKQKLEDEVKFSSEKKKQLSDNIACMQAKVKALQDKVDEHKLVKEEQHALEVTLQEVEDKITKHTTDCAALQSEVEQNNVQIQKLKDDIASLQKQTQGRDFDEKEAREVQELEETLNDNKQQLEINVQKIEEKLKENNKLKQSNKEMTVELEQLKLSNVEAEKQLKEATEKNEEELNSLRLKIKQLNKDIQSKKENIKNLIESSGKLDLDIEEGTGIVSYMKESLENLRTQKLATETEMSKIKADIIKTENLIPTSDEEFELEEQISALEVKLQEKQKERDDLEKKLSYLKQENQLAKDLIQKVQNCEKEKLMKQEAESPGIFSWLPSWGSTSNQQDPSN